MCPQSNAKYDQLRKNGLLSLLTSSLAARIAGAHAVTKPLPRIRTNQRLSRDTRKNHWKQVGLKLNPPARSGPSHRVHEYSQSMTWKTSSKKTPPWIRKKQNSQPPKRRIEAPVGVAAVGVVDDQTGRPPRSPNRLPMKMSNLWKKTRFRMSKTTS